MKRGLRVETTVLPVTDGIAYENVDFSTRKQDKRQGWRGPEARLDGAARRTFVERQEKLYGDRRSADGRRYLALVEKVNAGGAKVRIGGQRYDAAAAQHDVGGEVVEERRDQRPEDHRRDRRAARRRRGLGAPPAGARAQVLATGPTTRS